MPAGCARTTTSSGGCACAPPTKNIRTSTFYFCLALLGGLLFLAFNTVRGYEEEILNAQSVGMVLILGFLTGLHCIGMCGGFMMSYMRYGNENGMSEWQMHLSYGVSKVLSYAFFGAVFGVLGSLVYFSNSFKSIISLLGGFLLLYLGAKGLGFFARLKKWKFIDKIQLKSNEITHPVSVGLLKGLMISCAPLQGLYLVAAGLGDPLKGALLLGVFGLGTLPIFLFYGVFVGSLNHLQAKWSDIITASILVVFGVLMINRGMALGGYNFTLTSIERLATNGTPERCYEPLEGTQNLAMNATRNGWSITEIPYEYGQKICWEINVIELTMCNKAIEIPQLGIKKNLEEGINYIEFDPLHHESLVYTCWMGMMKGTFVAQ